MDTLEFLETLDRTAPAPSTSQPPPSATPGISATSGTAAPATSATLGAGSSHESAVAAAVRGDWSGIDRYIDEIQNNLD